MIYTLDVLTIFSFVAFFANVAIRGTGGAPLALRAVSTSVALAEAVSIALVVLAGGTSIALSAVSVASVAPMAFLTANAGGIEADSLTRVGGGIVALISSSAFVAVGVTGGAPAARVATFTGSDAVALSGVCDAIDALIAIHTLGASSCSADSPAAFSAISASCRLAYASSCRNRVLTFLTIGTFDAIIGASGSRISAVGAFDTGRVAGACRV